MWKKEARSPFETGSDIRNGSDLHRASDYGRSAPECLIEVRVFFTSCRTRCLGKRESGVTAGKHGKSGKIPVKIEIREASKAG